jgi:hypothetical protein
MREFLVFTAILGLVIAVTTGVVYALGGSFGLNLSESWSLAILLVVLVVPGAVCIRLFVIPDPHTTRKARFGNLMRGIGMLVMAIGAALPIFTMAVPSSARTGALVSGFALYIISLFFL